jgi:hypothetical protein
MVAWLSIVPNLNSNSERGQARLPYPEIIDLEPLKDD